MMFGYGGEENVLSDGGEGKNRIRKFSSFEEVIE
jgi:hypothetical protein